VIFVINSQHNCLTSTITQIIPTVIYYWELSR